MLVNEELDRSVTQCHQTRWVSPANISNYPKHHPAMREASLHSAPEIYLGNIGKRQSQVKVWPSKDQHWWICEGLRFRSSSILESTATLGTYMNALKFGVYSIPLGTLRVFKVLWSPSYPWFVSERPHMTITRSAWQHDHQGKVKGRNWFIVLLSFWWVTVR